MMSEPAQRISTNGINSANELFGQYSNTSINNNKNNENSNNININKNNNDNDNKYISDSLNLSPGAKEQLRKLKQRDAEVRAHEAAHLAAAGQYSSGSAHYEYQKGPDGKQYAIGGHVSIDTSPIPGDPKKTEQKAQQIRRAAMAPGSPSAQDNKVAASAAKMEAEAKVDKQKEKNEENANSSQISDFSQSTISNENKNPSSNMIHGIQAYANMNHQDLIASNSLPHGGLAISV